MTEDDHKGVGIVASLGLDWWDCWDWSQHNSGLIDVSSKVLSLN